MPMKKPELYTPTIFIEVPMNNELSLYWNKRFRESEGKFFQTSAFGIKACQMVQEKNLVSLLELGSGKGRDTFHFDKQGLKVTAVDISDELVKYVKKRSNATVIQSDIKDINFPGNHFDVVYARLSLHYFSNEDTEMIFGKIFNCLKPSGIFFAQCKSLNDHDYGKGEKIAEHTFKHGHIRHFFSMEYMKEKAHKFNIIELYEETDDNYGEQINTINLICSKP